MTTVRSLLTRWGFDVDTKPIDKFNKAIGDAKTTVTLIGAQALASAGSLFGLANSVSKTGDEFAKTASRMGINVETLQEYSHVAQLAGASTQEMNTSLESLTLGIAEARKGGGKLIEPLIRLNQLTGKDLLTNLGSADDVMLQLSDTFAAMSDETEKAELATKIFGGTGLQMVNVLNQGSSAINKQRMEARQLGIVLSERAAKSAELFQDSLLRAKAVVTGIKNSIGVELMPVVMDFMEQFRAWVSLNRAWIKSTITKSIRGTVDWMKKLIKVADRMSTVIGAMIRSLGGLEHVLNVVSFAFLAFAGIKFLSAIGTMTEAIGGGLVLAFKAVGNSALMAQAKMAAMPILIGLAVAAIFLLIDDVLAFFDGRDSITGKIIKAFEGVDLASLIREKLDAASIVVKEFSDKVNGWISGLFDFEDPGPAIAKFVSSGLKEAQKFFDGLSLENFQERIGQILLDIFTGESLVGSILGFFVTTFQAIGDALLLALGGVVNTALDALKGLGGGLLDFSGKDGAITKGFDAVKGLFGFGDEESDTSKNLAQAGVTAPKPGVSPDLKLVQGGKGSAGSTTITNQNQINVPVNIPEGSTPTEGAKMVEEGINNALGQLARETQVATASNVER